MAKARKTPPNRVTIGHVTNMLHHIESCCRTVRQVLTQMGPETKIAMRKIGAVAQGDNPWDWECPPPDRPCPDCDCDPCKCKGKRKKDKPTKRPKA